MNGPYDNRKSQKPHYIRICINESYYDLLIISFIYTFACQPCPHLKLFHNVFVTHQRMFVKLKCLGTAPGSGSHGAQVSVVVSLEMIFLYRHACK
jgi:hypothetical protein